MARTRTFLALRVIGGSECVEEFPVWFAGVEECSVPVVGESSEPERGAFDASGEVDAPIVACQAF